MTIVFINVCVCGMSFDVNHQFQYNLDRFNPHPNTFDCVRPRLWWNNDDNDDNDNNNNIETTTFFCFHSLSFVFYLRSKVPQFTKHEKSGKQKTEYTTITSNTTKTNEKNKIKRALELNWWPTTRWCSIMQNKYWIRFDFMLINLN